MTTQRAALKAAVQRLRAAGVATPVLDARLLVQHALGCGWDQLFTGPDRALDPAEAEALDALLVRREGREPVGRIVGSRAFWTLELGLSAETLEPRPETETVVEAAIAQLGGDRARVRRLLDLGTGSGALLLALLKEFPDARGVGTDLAAGALQTAAANARAAGLAERARLLQGDWLAPLAGEPPFDLVVSNPPYIESGVLETLPPEVRLYDPRLALDGGPDGLAAYRAIAPGLPGLLAPLGLVLLEVGAGQDQAVAALLEQGGLTPLPPRRDLARVARVVAAMRA